MLVILAAGSSSRLWPIKDKSLVNFLGKSLLEQQLDIYITLGFTNIVVICNISNKSSIEEILSTLSIQYRNIDFKVTIQSNQKGMGDALLSLKPISGTFPIYLCQVHDIFDSSFHHSLLQSFNTDQTATWIAAYKVKSYFPGGYLVVDGNMTIMDIVEKPKPGLEPSDLVNIVAHIHPNLDELLYYIDNEYKDSSIKTDDHYERAMAKMMKKSSYKAVPYNGSWNPIKYPWHILRAMDYYLHIMHESYISQSAKIEDGANIVGPVIIEDGVRIFKGADIRGPVYIGKGSLIGQFAQVRHSMIGSNCEIGLGSEVNRSYIGQGARLHSSKALDSILADNRPGQYINLAAGSITANLRVDYKNIYSAIKGDRIDTERDKLGAMIGAGTFIGINAALMPGIKIGEECIIGPGTIVDQDIPDKSRFFVKQDNVLSSLNEKDK
ncbi:MAG: NTP transferase domain-containing protein [Chloroflexi bacterium]|nr:NTP transferase domain-containing protein [Chloroflexota bacterium]